ncbi:MAG: hypothetical protein WAK18_16950 [Nocardioidaceae bacterium]
MIRKSLTAVATTAVIAVGGATMVDISTGATADASSSITSTRFVAHDIAGNMALDDLADPQGGGPGLGDMLAFSQRLSRAGKTVGRVSNVAVGVDARRNLFHATGTLSLARGTVEFGGLVSQTSHFVLAVTGGTGMYNGARGTLVFSQSGNRQILTLNLAR